MSYEDALKRYTAKRFDIDINTIASVDADHDTRWGGYCETCEYQYSVIEFRVHLTNGKTVTHDEEREFTELLKELIDA